MELTRRDPFAPASIFDVEPFEPAPAPACPAGHLEVRCCCRPENLLGWLPAPSDDTVHREGPLAQRVVHFRIGSTTRVTLPVDQYWAVDQEPYPAYRSDDTPIEILRLIPGFLPAVVQL